MCRGAGTHFGGPRLGSTRACPALLEAESLFPAGKVLPGPQVPIGALSPVSPQPSPISARSPGSKDFGGEKFFFSRLESGKGTFLLPEWPGT